MYKGYIRFRSLLGNKTFLMFNSRGELRNERIKSHRTMWFKLNTKRMTLFNHKYNKRQYKKMKNELLDLVFQTYNIHVSLCCLSQTGRRCKLVPRKSLQAIYNP